VGSGGNGWELLNRPAYLALTNPDISSCNNVDFLRDDANLAIVVISDAFDQDNANTNPRGPLPYSFYLNAFYNIKGLSRQNMLTFNAIHPMHYNTATCEQDGSEPEPPDPWASDDHVVPIIKATAGIEGDICTDDWSQTLQDLGKTAFGYRTRFFLLNVPDTSQVTTDGGVQQNEIIVQLQGINDAAPHACKTDADCADCTKLQTCDPIAGVCDRAAVDPAHPTSMPRWTYNSAANAIDFESVVPPPGMTVFVKYAVACGH
jgi:hypothetical protein